ncbi:hypothetical protein Nepgr_014424 [Nepenthes gracilis]|uniref:DUF7815 domain-containing protein n=1 Tax=Nepenthes gracilis TaxID=150966 RepID=A0AAD3XPU6_NEPGR|nr:hypothetical protein Nepgr_014424 [Nepenthes gracilis]
MAYEVPRDPVEQVRILLRKEAGLESYNPNDSSALLITPTLEEGIANFDPSPVPLRCKHCNGQLLRGLQYIICVYCGREQQEFLPEYISFKTTVGCQWLLESLGLDGTEIVVPPVEDSRTNRRQSVSNNEIFLSNLIDLKMKWPDESDRFGFAVVNEAPIPGKRFGVDSDGLFSGAKRETVSSMPNEQLMPNETRKNESTAFQEQGSLSLFDNQQSCWAPMEFDEVEQADSFSGWEADFQSDSSVTL